MDKMGAFIDIDGQPVDKKFVMKWSWVYDDDIMILDDKNDDTTTTNMYLEIFLKPDQEHSDKFFEVIKDGLNLSRNLTLASEELGLGGEWEKL